ncbi:MAG: hypothetical protein EHM24_03945, partial [Acidobacteria bacterium]
MRRAAARGTPDPRGPRRTARAPVQRVPRLERAAATALRGTAHRGLAPVTPLLAPPPGAAFLPDLEWEGRGSLILANPEWARRWPQATGPLPSLLPDLAGHVWLATSGSTSADPSHVTWVALAKTAILASAAAVNAHLESTAADTWAHALPLFHAGGLGILARARLSGARVIAAVEGRWDAWRFRERLVEERCTLTALVPSQVHDLVTARFHPPPSLRAVIVGGARLDPELHREARGLGWPCLPSYGLTETASQVATATLGSLSSRSYPVVLPLLAHAAARAGSDGRLELRAASLLTCYAEATEDGARVWDPKHEGWFATDDLGVVYAEGIEVLGRASDSVKVLGELVPLSRVEAQARTWASEEPMLRGLGLDLAVVAPPHQRLGHELILVVAHPDHDVLRRLDLDALRESLLRSSQDTLLPFKRVLHDITDARTPRTT